MRYRYEFVSHKERQTRLRQVELNLAKVALIKFRRAHKMKIRRLEGIPHTTYFNSERDIYKREWMRYNRMMKRLWETLMYLTKELNPCGDLSYWP